MVIVSAFSAGDSGWTLLERLLSSAQSWPGSHNSWAWSGLLICLQAFCRGVGEIDFSAAAGFLIRTKIALSSL